MNVNTFGSLNISSPRNFTLNFPPAGSPPVDFNPFNEATVRDVFAQQDQVATSHVKSDNAGDGSYWGSDIDPSVGRLVRRTSSECQELESGKVNLAMALSFDPSSKKPLTMDMTSENGNFEKHVRWTGDAITHSLDRRTLADGARQSVEIVVNPETGVLTYTESVEPAPPK